jgi:hypothetical protein
MRSQIRKLQLSAYLSEAKLEPRVGVKRFLAAYTYT